MPVRIAMDVSAVQDKLQRSEFARQLGSAFTKELMVRRWQVFSKGRVRQPRIEFWHGIELGQFDIGRWQFMQSGKKGAQVSRGRRILGVFIDVRPERDCTTADNHWLRMVVDQTNRGEPVAGQPLSYLYLSTSGVSRPGDSGHHSRCWQVIQRILTESYQRPTTPIQLRLQAGVLDCLTSGFRGKRA